MAFWIIIGIIAALLVAGLVHTWTARWADWGYFWAWAVIAFVVAVIGLFVCVAGAGAQTAGGGTWTLQKSYGLRALVTQENTETHSEASFFLGFGYASSDTTTVKSISYIQVAKDGGSTLHKVGIHSSVIYEDADSKPYMENWVKIGHNNHAFVPWDFTYETFSGTQHRFHIPKGSILEKYEVKP